MSSARRLDAFQRWALATTAATYALIGVGALVRATGSGLGCPDWPKCFGRWIPPLSAADVPSHIDPALFNFAKAWTEYLNRLLGVSVGFLIFATLVLAIVHHRRSPRILYSTIAAFVLVGVEGFNGGRVVASKLSPIILTVHLVLALVIAGLLLYATVSAFFPRGRPRDDLSPRERALARAAFGVTALALAQIGVGAALRGEITTLAVAATAPREQWLELAGALGTAHKLYSLVVLGAVVLLAWTVHKRAAGDRWLSGVALAALVLVGAQILGGSGLAFLGLPALLQLLHLWIGALMLGVLTLLTLLLYRLDPRRT